MQNIAPTEISTRLNVPISSVRNVLADPLFKSHVERMQDATDDTALTVRKRLAQMTVAALDRAEDILDPTTPNVPWPVVASVVKDVLDRNGFAAPTQVRHSHLHFTREDLERLRNEAILNGAQLPSHEVASDCSDSGCMDAEEFYDVPDEETVYAR